MRTIQPEGWPRPRGYSNGVVCEPGGRLLFVAGQIGWDEHERLAPGGLVAQFEQALANVAAVVFAGGGAPEHIARLTIYVTDKRAYRAVARELGEAYRRVLGARYPAMALVQVADLLEDGALVEVEATAVLPSPGEGAIGSGGGAGAGGYGGRGAR